MIENFENIHRYFKVTMLFPSCSGTGKILRNSFIDER